MRATGLAIVLCQKIDFFIFRYIFMWQFDFSWENSWRKCRGDCYLLDKSIKNDQVSKL